MNETLTNEQVRRIKSAIADYDRYISRESARPADTRPREVAARLEQYRTKRAELAHRIANR